MASNKSSRRLSTMSVGQTWHSNDDEIETPSPEEHNAEAPSAMSPSSKANQKNGSATQGNLLSTLCTKIPKVPFFLKTLCSPELIVTALISTGITAFVINLDGDKWKEAFSDSKTAISILGALLTFSLAFRLNVCCALVKR